MNGPAPTRKSEPVLSRLRVWGEFVKLPHTIFALPFALSAMVVASRHLDPPGWPGWRIFGLILAAMVCARTCAMAFNRIVDRKFDAQNSRTASRALPAGRITLAGAWCLCVASGAGLVLASVLLNPLCFYLSPVALVVICFYSLTKRFTDYTHVFLGLALALAPVGGWLAVRGTAVTWLELLSLMLLGTAVVFWLVGFDIIYALQDYEFDRRHGLHSLVVGWGPKNALDAAFLAHLFMWLLLAVFGLVNRFRLAYLAGMILILGAMLLEHWLARRRSLKWIHISFFRMNALISLVFLLATTAEVIFRGGFKMR